MGYYEDRCEDLECEVRMLKSKIEDLEQALHDNGDDDIIADIRAKYESHEIAKVEGWYCGTDFIGDDADLFNRIKSDIYDWEAYIIADIPKWYEGYILEVILAGFNKEDMIAKADEIIKRSISNCPKGESFDFNGQSYSYYLDGDEIEEERTWRDSKR